MKDLNFISPFKKLCITIGNLPTAYIESMSYYEGLTFLVNYLANNVIPAVNNNSEVVKELQDQFIILKEYVDNYFENLDVQEEINNKLDEMADSGELTDIIAQYLGLAGVLAFDTVADLKAADNLVDGSTARTLGYYSIGDDGAALYSITDTIPSGHYEILNSGLYAALIPDEYVKSKQVGIKGDNTNEVTELQNLVNTYEKVLLTKGNYYITSTLTLNNIKELKGEEGTVIKATDSSGQTEILLVNGNSDFKLSHFKIEGTALTNNGFTGLRLHQCTNGIVEEVEITGSRMGMYTTQSQFININKCYVHDTVKDGFAVSDGSNNVTISQCRAVDTGDDSFAVISYTANDNITSDIKIVNNTAIGCKKRSFLVDGGENILFANNFALNGKNQLFGVIGQSDWSTTETKNIIVDSNIGILTDATDLENDSFTALTGIQRASYVTFTNNRLDESAISAVTTRHNPIRIRQCHDVIFSNNYVDGNGLNLKQVDNAEITNNVIKHGYTYGIYLQSTNNMLCSDNMIIDYNTKNTSSYVFGIDAEQDTIDGNTVNNTYIKLNNNFIKTENNSIIQVQIPAIEHGFVNENNEYEINIENATNITSNGVLRTSLSNAKLESALNNGTIVCDNNGILKVKTNSGMQTITLS